MVKYTARETDKRVITVNLVLNLITIIGIIILLIFCLKNTKNTGILCTLMAILIFFHFILKKIIMKNAVKRTLNFEFLGDTFLVIKISEKNEDDTWNEKEYKINEDNFYNFKTYNNGRRCEIIYITNVGEHESIFFNLPKTVKTADFIESLKRYAEKCLRKNAKE